MSKKITISGVHLSVQQNVDEQIQSYFQILENHYQNDVLEDVKSSVLEKLYEISKQREINSTDLDQIKAEIGVEQKPIYKRFFRYGGMFGGVANGIGSYFKIPVFIPRVVFAIPLITLALAILEFGLVYILPQLNIPFVFINYTNNGYTFSSFTENILNRSDWLVLIYITMWIFVPRAKTQDKIEQIDGKDIENDQLYLAILNKVTYQNKLIKQTVSKILFIVAKIGIFLFDVLVSVLNNIFSNLFFRFLIFIVIVWGIFMLILGLFFTAKPNLSGSETLESSSVYTVEK